MVTGKCNNNAFEGHHEYSWGKIHDNELRIDLVDLLHLAYPALMITEVRDAHTI